MSPGLLGTRPGQCSSGQLLYLLSRWLLPAVLTCLVFSSCILCWFSRSSVAVLIEDTSWSVLYLSRSSLRLLSMTCCFPLVMCSSSSPSLPPASPATAHGLRASDACLHARVQRPLQHATGGLLQLQTHRQHQHVSRRPGAPVSVYAWRLCASPCGITCTRCVSALLSQKLPIAVCC